MGHDITRAEAEQNGLVITVLGRADRGKTTVARLIEEMLRREGFKDVSVYDNPVDSSPDKAPIEQRVAAAKERVICIETEEIVIGSSKPRMILPGEVPMAED